ncbi:hypothetical protein [Enterovibrio norvegicus]|uniref:hypothetical protein n=1 Tax=Enterovibrio norvegicus TaxID=188144 RepID=UPI00354C4CD6
MLSNIFRILLALPFVLIAAYSYTVNFIPTKENIIFSKILAGIFFAFLLFSHIRKALDDRNYREHSGEMKYNFSNSLLVIANPSILLFGLIPRKIRNTSMVFLIIPALCYLGFIVMEQVISYGAASIYNRNMSPQTVSTVLVKKKEAKKFRRPVRKRRSLNYKIFITKYDVDFSVNEEIYNSLAIGSELSVIVKTSKFGSLVELDKK